MAAKSGRRAGKAADQPPHRGRIQAQGGGIEKSVSWSRETPPTETEMMELVHKLELQLSRSERLERHVGFEQLRRFIRRAAKEGGTSIVPSRSFPPRPKRGVRVDIEILTGMAAVPDKG